MSMKHTHVKDWPRLRAKRLLAREALFRAGTPDFKSRSSAKWADYGKTVHNCLLAQVQHDDVKGCTPEMIQWFFEHLGCCTTWNGVDFSGPTVSIYHLWHHRDHVAVTPLTHSADGKQNTGFLQGANSRIHELTNEVNDVIYFEMNTVRLDTHEFTFTVLMNGKPTGHVKHLYEPTAEGCSFYAETMVGIEHGGTLFNSLVVPKLYTQKAGMEWIDHNIQETGRMQDILPVLYANQDQVFFDREFIQFD